MPIRLEPLRIITKWIYSTVEMSLPLSQAIKEQNLKYWIILLGYDIYKYFVSLFTVMSEDVFAEDKAVKEILKDETLDGESTAYDVSETQSDSNQADAEKDNTAT